MSVVVVGRCWQTGFQELFPRRTSFGCGRVGNQSVSRQGHAEGERRREYHWPRVLNLTVAR